MKVLVACEESAKVREAFKKRGHDAWSCDLKKTRVPGQHIQGDVLNVLDEGGVLMIAHPVCKRLANSGVRWLHNPPAGKTKKEMWEGLEEAAKFYKALRDADIGMKAIENPIMHKYAKKLIGQMTRQIVQPWWFGDKAFKATGLELINLPELIPTNKLIPPKSGTEEHKQWSQCHRAPPGPNREQFRSETYQGLADAMAQQWSDI